MSCHGAISKFCVTKDKEAMEELFTVQKSWSNGERYQRWFISTIIELTKEYFKCLI